MSAPGRLLMSSVSDPGRGCPKADRCSVDRQVPCRPGASCGSGVTTAADRQTDQDSSARRRPPRRVEQAASVASSTHDP